MHFWAWRRVGDGGGRRDAAELRLIDSGDFSYAVGGWLPQYGIELRFDQIGAFALPASLLGVLSLVFSRRYVARAMDPESYRFTTRSC